MPVLLILLSPEAHSERLILTSIKTIEGASIEVNRKLNPAELYNPVGFKKFI